MTEKFNWLDVEDLGYELNEAYPDLNPIELRFTKLRDLIEGLACFEAEEGHNVNESILEAIQGKWYEEFLEAKGDA